MYGKDLMEVRKGKESGLKKTTHQEKIFNCFTEEETLHSIFQLQGTREHIVHCREATSAFDIQKACTTNLS